MMAFAFKCVNLFCATVPAGAKKGRSVHKHHAAAADVRGIVIEDLFVGLLERIHLIHNIWLLLADILVIVAV